MVLLMFPSLVGRKRRFPLEIRCHRDPLSLAPRQREVLVLEFVRESDMTRRNEIAKTRSASARICIVRGI